MATSMPGAVSRRSGYRRRMAWCASASPITTTMTMSTACSRPSTAFFAQAIRRNGGLFDGVLDFVGGRMLSACCRLTAIDANLASITEAPALADAEYLFQRNGSFHAIGANAYSLTEDRSQWRR